MNLILLTTLFVIIAATTYGKPAEVLSSDVEPKTENGQELVPLVRRKRCELFRQMVGNFIRESLNFYGVYPNVQYINVGHGNYNYNRVSVNNGYYNKVYTNVYDYYY